MKHFYRLPLTVLSLLLFAGTLPAQEETLYFYHGRDFGSEANYNPLSVIINGGFDVLQASTHSRNLSTVDFGTGFTNVWDNITNPIPQIDKYGWSRFLGQEVFPSSFRIDKAQYFPNYTLHLIGGGMTYRATREWYIVNGVPEPTLCALASMAAYHLLNETVENSSFRGPNVDPIADVLIFDPAGILLFLSDDVSEFFSSTMHLADWSGQAMIDPRFGTIQNHGQNFIMKYRLGFLPTTSIFYYFGDSGMLGLSFLRSDNTSISVSGGLATTEVRQVDVRNGARTVSVSLGWMSGIFYDRDNSLLMSLIFSDRTNDRMRFNIYPGIIHLGPVSPGLFCGVAAGRQLTAGFTVRYTPLGIAYRNRE